MSNLTQQSYWEDVHREHVGVRSMLSRLISPRAAEFLLRRHTDDVIYKTAVGPHLPPRRDWRLLEVGSAPGDRLLFLHERFGYEPWGVEYTEAGVEANRALFKRHGHDPDHVIHADFFDPHFQHEHRGAFDVVFSHGFIEHFDDPASVVRQHLDLVKPGGRLVVHIPNLSGLNAVLTRFFNPRLLDYHNLTIMKRHAFARLFELPGLYTRFCDYVGIFTFNLQAPEPDSWKSRVHLA